MEGIPSQNPPQKSYFTFLFNNSRIFVKYNFIKNIEKRGVLESILDDLSCYGTRGFLGNPSNSTFCLVRCTPSRNSVVEPMSFDHA